MKAKIVKGCVSTNIRRVCVCRVCTYLSGCDESALCILRHRVPHPRVRYVNRPEHVTWWRGVDSPQVRGGLGRVVGDNGRTGKGQYDEGGEYNSPSQKRPVGRWRGLHHSTLPRESRPIILHIFHRPQITASLSLSGQVVCCLVLVGLCQVSLLEEALKLNPKLNNNNTQIAYASVSNQIYCVLGVIFF